MPRALAIRNVTALPGGGFEIAYTDGPTPLPSAPSGTFRIRSPEVLRKDVRSFATMPAYQLLLMHLALTWINPDGSFNHVAEVVGKRIELDRSNATPIRIL